MFYKGIGLSTLMHIMMAPWARAAKQATPFYLYTHIFHEKALQRLGRALSRHAF